MKGYHYHLPILCFVALSCIITVTHSCQGRNSAVVSVPEITLQKLHGGCHGDHRSRHPDCLAAMHRFCNRITYTSKMTTLGVSRENINHRIGTSCIKSHWAGHVNINDIRRLHGGCNLHKSQHRDCLAATHRYCWKKFGQGYAGISQEVGRDFFEIHCFQVARKEAVRWQVLNRFVPSCRYPKSDFSTCFSAASRWCMSLGHSGGITQEVGHGRMTVACYNAVFSGDVFTVRTYDFYKAISTATAVCSLKYRLNHNKLLQTNPDMLKFEVYDNSKSSVPLESSFQVTKEVTETSRFEYSASLQIGFEVSVSVGIPMIAEGKITLSASLTQSFSKSHEKKMTKRYTQTSPVHVPPKHKIIKEAKVTRANLMVPFTATVMNALGNLKTINGKWYGVTTFDLQIVQRNG